jgi:hypothetical protein
MPAFANISLKNQAAVEVVYTPADIDPTSSVARYLGAGASFDARPQVTISTSYPKGNSTKVKVKGKIVFPVMDTLDTTKKVDENIGQFEFSMSKSSALLTRQDLRAALADFLVDTTVVTAVENFESVY